MRNSILYTLLCSLILICSLASCSETETYAEQKDKEFKAIQSFLDRDIVIRGEDGDIICNVGKIEAISEEQFIQQDSTTDGKYSGTHSGQNITRGKKDT